MQVPDFTDPQCLTDLINSVQVGPEVLTGVAIGLLVFGVLNCFFGYPLFRVLLGIFAGIAGGLLSFSLSFQFFGADLPAAAITGVTAAVLCAIVLFQLYYVSVFIIGSGLGVFLASTATNMLGYGQVPLAMAISGVVAGLLALVIQKAVIILATALFGALYAVMGFAQLIGAGIDLEKLRSDPTNIVDWRNPDTKLYIMAGCVVVLAIAGIVVQYLILRKVRRRKEQTVQADDSYDED